TAGFHHNKLADSVASTVAIICASLPSFAFALLLSYFIGFKLKLLPFIYAQQTPLSSSILPAIALSVAPMASVARYTRSEIIDVLNQNYITLAKTKGIGKFPMIVKHVMRNVLTGVITVIAPATVNVLTGSLVVEKAFAVPGIGGLLITAIQENDYNVTFTLAFIYCALYIGIMLVVDILYGVIDPRIRVAKGE
ncbi:MAG: ABC transporter permease, partial [Clostridiales bacterium]|nr:ABC transporter permease [Clostridiales bacterium]